MTDERSYSRREALVTLSALGLGGASMLGLTSCCNNQDGVGEDEARPIQSPDYSLQEKISALVVPEKVTVIRTGGFGSWVGLIAAMAGVSQLALWDPAGVDALDLARTPFRPTDVGQPKAVALASLISEARPDARVVARDEFFRLPEHESQLAGVVFNGASDQELHDLMPGVVAGAGLKYAAGFYKGVNVGVTTQRVATLKLGRAPDATPVWVGSCVISAALAVHSAFVSPVEFAGNISDITLNLKELERRFGETLEDAMP